MYLPECASLETVGCKASGTMYYQQKLPSGRRLSKTPMVNESELVINPVKAKRRKVVTRLAKMALLPVDITLTLISIQPSCSRGRASTYGSWRKSIARNMVNPINPISQHKRNGSPTIRKGEDLAGRGSKRKRTPICNGLDRGFYNERIICKRGYPTRKSADFEGGRD